MKIKKLKVYNWKCFKSQKWTFKNKELIIAPNGTGKSSMFEAIKYCIWGKVPTGFTMNTVRNDPEKNCRMEMEFTFGKDESNHAIIKREFGSKSEHELWINDELVAESVRTIEPFMNKIADFSISNELWTNSITTSNILYGDYFTKTILEDKLKDPNELLVRYKYKIRESNKVINSFDEEIMDYEGIKSSIENIQNKLKDKGASNEEYTKALKVLTAYENLESIGHPKLELEKSKLFGNAISSYNSIEEAKTAISKAIDEENSYKEFEKREKPSVSKEKHQEVARILNGKDLETVKNEVKNKIEEESAYKKDFESRKTPTRTQEQTNLFMQAVNGGGSTIEEVAIILMEKIDKENAYKQFESMKSPYADEENYDKFSRLLKSMSLTDKESFNKYRDTKKEEYKVESSKSINRFLGIPDESIMMCVEKSLKDGVCIFCREKFTQEHADEIIEELNKPSRDSEKVERLKSLVSVLDIYENWENYEYDVKYRKMKKEYEDKVNKENPYLESLEAQLDVLTIYDSIEEAKEDIDYWKSKLIYDEKSKDESYLNSLKDNYSMLEEVYKSMDDFNKDAKYWEDEKEYLIKLNSDKSYLKSLESKLEHLSFYEDVKSYEKDLESHHALNTYQKFVSMLPNYKDILRSYDEDNLKLWDEYEDLQKEFRIATAQQERINKINELKIEVEEHKVKISVIQEYIAKATRFYISRIMDAATETLQSINSRYKAIYLDDKFFNVVLENDSDKTIGTVPVAQLSTGERTICALSMLFAVHDIMVPELPFLFDEVFAGLDAVNMEEVKRFLSTKNSQIFIITHDKSWYDV